MVLQRKRLTGHGGITIPQKLRHEMGLHAGTPLELTLEEDGLRIVKACPACHFCGSVDEVRSFKGVDVCGECSASIKS